MPFFACFLFVDNTERHFYLFDTFEGLPEPSEKDEARAKAIWNQVHSGVNINKQKAPHRAEDGKVRSVLPTMFCLIDVFYFIAALLHGATTTTTSTHARV